jgi:hypothetical protein
MNSWLILRQQQMAMQVASYTYTCEFLYIRTQQTTPGPRAAPPLLGTRMQTVSFSSRSLIKASPTQSSATELVLSVEADTEVGREGGYGPAKSGRCFV